MVAARWVIFCRVIDNLGDAGVCWRLAKQLANEHSLAIDLVIDQPQVLNIFDTDLTRFQINIHSWDQAEHLALGHVTIAAFACRLPAGYQQRLAQKQAKQQTNSPQRNWFNLEYLSAESWADSTHLLTSTHASGATETFFMPGFTAKTGGLLREARFQHHQPRQAIREQWGLDNQFAVSLFCYANAKVPALLTALDTWALQQHTKVVVLVNRSLHAALTTNGLLPDQPASGTDSGRVTIQSFDFLTQDNYDNLLLACDLNFVRGEDSWVRAIWAGQPFVWQAYQQDSVTTLAKVEAYLKHWSRESGLPLQHPSAQAYLDWNGREPSYGQLWLDCLAPDNWHQWQQASQQYCDRLSQIPDLASQLLAASTTI